MKEKKLYAPRWVGWFITLIIGPIWVWLTYSYICDVASARAELGLIGYIMMSFVFLVAITVCWLMALGKLPAYVIRENENEKKPT